MAWEFEADSTQQKTLGESLDKAGQTFISNCTTIKGKVEGMSANWEGADYTAFAQGVEGYFPALEDLGHTFQLFGQHFKSMSGATGELGEGLIALVNALLEGGAGATAGAGMAPEGAGEGSGTEGGAGATTNTNPNAYGGRTFTDERGNVYETDADGNVVYSKEDNTDTLGTVQEKYIDKDGNIMTVTTFNDGTTSVSICDRYGNDIKSTYDGDAFDVDNHKFQDGYKEGNLSTVGNGTNEYGGYNVRDTVFRFDGEEIEQVTKYDGKGNEIQSITTNRDGNVNSITTHDVEGRRLRVEYDASGAITAATLSGTGVSGILNLTVEDGKITDERLTSDFDPATGMLNETGTKKVNVGKVSVDMSEDQYARVSDETKTNKDDPEKTSTSNDENYKYTTDDASKTGTTLVSEEDYNNNSDLKNKYPKYEDYVDDMVRQKLGYDSRYNPAFKDSWKNTDTSTWQVETSWTTQENRCKFYYYESNGQRISATVGGDEVIYYCTEVDGKVYFYDKNYNSITQEEATAAKKAYDDAHQ